MSPLHHGDQILELVADQSIFDYADALSVRVPTSCGRTGECHECIVEVRKGVNALTPLTEEEQFLRGNYRLACQARVADPLADIDFSVLRRQPRILTRGTKRTTELQPAYSRVGDEVVYPRGPDLEAGGTEESSRRVIIRHCWYRLPLLMGKNNYR
mgnify:CR=1 FL=1